MYCLKVRVCARSVTLYKRTVVNIRYHPGGVKCTMARGCQGREGCNAEGCAWRDGEEDGYLSSVEQLKVETEAATKLNLGSGLCLDSSLVV